MAKEETPAGLQIGEMKMTDLATWFGISPRAFNNYKAKKLEELEMYCDFVIISPRAIRIDEIDVFKYNKEWSKQQKALETFQEPFLKCFNAELDTCKNIAKKIYKKYPDAVKGRALSTIEDYATLTRNALFGRPGGEEPGLIGRCHRVACIRGEDDKENRTLRRLTGPEFEKIFSHPAFGNMRDQITPKTVAYFSKKLSKERFENFLKTRYAIYNMAIKDLFPGYVSVIGTTFEFTEVDGFKNLCYNINKEVRK